MTAYERCADCGESAGCVVWPGDNRFLICLSCAYARRLRQNAPRLQSVIRQAELEAIRAAEAAREPVPVMAYRRENATWPELVAAELHRQELFQAPKEPPSDDAVRSRGDHPS